MKFDKIKIEGLFLITPDIRYDERGYFFKSYQSKLYREQKINITITQVNHSLTKHKGTIRGMHFQKAPFTEAKIVQCLKGNIYDVVIDLRRDSPTYGKWHAEELSEENKRILFIPKGVAHGFQTLKDNVEILYLMSSQYSQLHSSGVRWNDPYFDIKWPLPTTSLAEKDKKWPLYRPQI